MKRRVAQDRRHAAIRSGLHRHRDVPIRKRQHVGQQIRAREKREADPGAIRRRFQQQLSRRTRREHRHRHRGAPTRRNRRDRPIRVGPADDDPSRRDRLDRRPRGRCREHRHVLRDDRPRVIDHERVGQRLTRDHRRRRRARDLHRRLRTHILARHPRREAAAAAFDLRHVVHTERAVAKFEAARPELRPDGSVARVERPGEHRARLPRDLTDHVDRPAADPRHREHRVRRDQTPRNPDIRRGPEAPADPAGVDQRVVHKLRIHIAQPILDHQVLAAG